MAESKSSGKEHSYGFFMASVIPRCIHILALVQIFRFSDSKAEADAGDISEQLRLQCLQRIRYLLKTNLEELDGKLLLRIMMVFKEVLLKEWKRANFTFIYDLLWSILYSQGVIYLGITSREENALSETLVTVKYFQDFFAKNKDIKLWQDSSKKERLEILCGAVGDMEEVLTSKSVIDKEKSGNDKDKSVKDRDKSVKDKDKPVNDKDKLLEESREMFSTTIAYMLRSHKKVPLEKLMKLRSIERAIYIEYIGQKVCLSKTT